MTFGFGGGESPSDSELVYIGFPVVLENVVPVGVGVAELEVRLLGASDRFLLGFRLDPVEVRPLVAPFGAVVTGEDRDWERVLVAEEEDAFRE